MLWSHYGDQFYYNRLFTFVQGIYKNAKTKVPLKDYLTMFNKTPNVIKPVKNVKL